MGKIVFFYILISSAYFYQGASANVSSRMDLALALSQDGTVQIDKYHKNTIDKAFYKDHYYSDKAPGLSFLGAAILKITNPIFALFKLDEEKNFRFKLYFLTCILLSLLTAWTAFVFYKFAVEMISSEGLAFALTLLCFTGTFVFAYSTIFFSHQCAGNFLFLSFYYLRKFDLLSHLQRFFLALMIAYACLLEYTVTPFFLLFYLYFIYKAWNSERFIFLPMILVSSILAVYNTIAFGAPWHLSYSFLQGSGFEEGMKKGFFGLTWPSLEALYKITFSQYRGLFYYSPVLLLSFVGAYFSWKDKEKRYISIGALLSFIYILYVNSCYAFWNGGACFGPRHMIPTLIVFFIPILFLPTKWLRNPLFWGLGLLGIFYQLVTTSVVLIPNEDEPYPFWSFIIQLFREGVLAINNTYAPVAHYLEFKGVNFNWDAWNLGQFLGLHGLYSLLPLVLCQVLFLTYAWTLTRVNKDFHG